GQWRDGRHQGSAAVAAGSDPAAPRQPQCFAWQRLSRLSRLFGGRGAPAIRDRMVSAMFDVTDVQGNILRGYRKPRVRHLILAIAEPVEARAWLGAAVSGTGSVPQVTTQAPWENKPSTCFNIGLTFEGLRALGATGQSLASFPTEFVEGMTARALKLGDIGDSAPERWPAPFDKPRDIHVIVSVHAKEVADLDRVQRQALQNARTF